MALPPEENIRGTLLEVSESVVNAPVVQNDVAVSDLSIIMDLARELADIEDRSIYFNPDLNAVMVVDHAQENTTQIIGREMSANGQSIQKPPTPQEMMGNEGTITVVDKGMMNADAIEKLSKAFDMDIERSARDTRDRLLMQASDDATQVQMSEEAQQKLAQLLMDIVKALVSEEQLAEMKEMFQGFGLDPDQSGINLDTFELTGGDNVINPKEEDDAVVNADTKPDTTLENQLVINTLGG